MIQTMQASLKQIRQVLGFGVQEFGDLIGLTRQSINNLETQKSKMSATQYVAISAVIDYCVKGRPELRPILSTILCSNDPQAENSVFASIENDSMIKKWFSCFSDESTIIGLPQEESGKITLEDFQNIAENYKVFLDQTILMKEGFSTALLPLEECMQKSGNRFIVPLTVITAIQYQMMNGKDREEQAAKRGMELLFRLQKKNLLDPHGEKSDVNTLSTILSVFSKFKFLHRLALITCDPQLAGRISTLNDPEIGGFHILVLTYSQEAGIQRWGPSDTDQTVEETPAPESSQLKQSEATPLQGWETIG